LDIKWGADHYIVAEKDVRKYYIEFKIYEGITISKGYIDLNINSLETIRRIKDQHNYKIVLIIDNGQFRKKEIDMKRYYNFIILSRSDLKKLFAGEDILEHI